MSKRKKKKWADDWSEQEAQVVSVLTRGWAKGKPSLLEYVKELAEEAKGKEEKIENE